MTPITATTEIARAPQEVFAYVTDPTRFVECSAVSSAGERMEKARMRWAKRV